MPQRQLRSELDHSVQLRADIMSERVALQERVDNAERAVVDAPTAFHQLEAQHLLKETKLRVAQDMMDVDKADEMVYSRDRGEWGGMLWHVVELCFTVCDAYGVCRDGRAARGTPCRCGSYPQSAQHDPR